MIYWIAVLSTLIAAEAVLAGSCLSMFFPPHASKLVADFFTTYQQSITPKRDVFFLRLFIIVGVSSFFALNCFFAQATASKRLSLKYFSIVQIALVSMETFCLFKYAVYHYPVFQSGFYVAFILSLLAKIFIPEILKLMKAFDARLQDQAPIENVSLWLTVSVGVLIPLIIWVPDVQGAVSRMFLGEQWHHIDWLLMAAGWAHLSGNIIGVDNISRYGLGCPVLTSEFCKHILGSFDYVHAVIAMMLASIVYYWIWFYSLRLVLKDTAWAFIALFLGFRLQFFHMETFPFIFTYPQLTPLRFFCDSLFFVFIISYIQTQRRRWIYLAAALSGFSVFYITGEGLYTLATFYVFLVLHEFFIKPLDKKQLPLLALTPWLALMVCLLPLVGAHIVDGSFWYNQFEYVRYYQAGNTTSPMLNNLAAPFVDRAAIAFVLPVIYMFLLVMFLGKLMQKKLEREGLVMIVACVFVLISYHYHAMIANNTPAYLRNGVITAMLTVFVIKGFAAHLDVYRQRLCKLAGGVFVLVITVTTHQFLLHPNIFNLSRNPMTHPVVSQFPVGRNSYFNHLFVSYPDQFKLATNGLGQTDEMLVTEKDFDTDAQMKDFVRRETDYTKDVALIQSLTTPDQKVPLVSSFENYILMQAKRRPFFYTYFMVNSQPRHMRKFPVTVLYTKQNALREMNLIDTLKPEYIFVEKTYLVSPFSQTYFYDNEDLITMLSYIFNHYQPYKAGEYLMALKRK